MRSAAGKYEFSKHILLVGLDLAPLRLGARGACPFRLPLDPPLLGGVLWGPFARHVYML